MTDTKEIIRKKDSEKTDNILKGLWRVRLKKYIIYTIRKKIFHIKQSGQKFCLIHWYFSAPVLEFSTETEPIVWR